MRSVEPGDREQVHELAQKNGLNSEHSAHRWAQFWRDNPAAKTEARLSGSKIIQGYVAVTKDKRVVGYVGSIPLSYAIGSTPIQARSIHSTVVDPNFRRPQGPGQLRTVQRLLRPFWDQCHDHAHIDLVVSTTASAAQERNHAKTGASRIPASALSHSLVWVHRYRQFVAAMARIHKLPAVGLWSPVAGLGLSLSQRLSGGTTKTLHRLPSVTKWTTQIGRGDFGTQDDQFWQALRCAYPERLLRSRDAESLRWNYELAAPNDPPWVIRLMRGQTVEGSAICVAKNVGGLRRLWIADIQLLEESTEGINAIMKAILGVCDQENFDVIELPGMNAAKRKLLEKLRPMQREQSSFRGWYTASTELSPRIQSSENWDVTGYDGDSSM